MVGMEDIAVAEEDDTRTSWPLTPDEYRLTVERCAKINARATKRGFTGRLAVTGTERIVSTKDAAGLVREHVVIDTVLTGDAPSYGGWYFLAAVDTLQTGNDSHSFVIRCAPGVDADTIDRSALRAGHCDHCKTSRINRKYTYLVRNESGETFQVGSTCIKDFTGWAGKLVFLAENTIGSEVFSGLGGTQIDYTVETVVAAAWGISRQLGWVPSSSMDRTSTRSAVDTYLYGRSASDRSFQQEMGPHIVAAAGQAKHVIATVVEEFTNSSGGFEQNLIACLSSQTVGQRQMGFVVSTVSAYERILANRVRAEQETAAAESKPVSEYAGVIGDKLTVTGPVVRLVPIEQTYGHRTTTAMLVIVESGSTVAKMFTTAAWAFNLQQGQTLTVTATVKAHDDYQGVKQTVLVRPKNIDAT